MLGDVPARGVQPQCAHEARRARRVARHHGVQASRRSPPLQRRDADRACAASSSRATAPPTCSPSGSRSSARVEEARTGVLRAYRGAHVACPSKRRHDAIYSRIAGTGQLPSRESPHATATSKSSSTPRDEWIYTRTGIRQRHIAADDEKTSDLALIASRRALEAAGLAAGGHRSHHRRHDDAGHGVSEHRLPAAGEARHARRCRRSTCRRCAAGFVYALATADHFDASRAMPRNALVVGAEVYSRILDWKDRAPACCSATAPARSCSSAAKSRASSPRICTPTAATRTSCRVPGQRVAAGQVCGRAVPADGRQRGVQVRGEGAGGGRATRRSPRPGSSVATRLADPAPGEHPHHPGDREEARLADGARRHDGRPARQHFCRIGSARARRSACATDASTGPARAAGRRRRRLHLGRGAVRW